MFSEFRRSSDDALFADGGTVTTTRPTLPPSDATPVRIVALSGTIVQQYHPETGAAMVKQTNPDCVVAAPPAASSVGPSLRGQLSMPVVRPGRGLRPDVITTTTDDTLVVTTPGGTRPLAMETITDELPSQGEAEGNSHTATEHRCIVTDALSLSVDPYDRAATVEGVAPYADRLPTAWPHETMTHLSTALRAGFTTTVELPSGSGEATVVGIGDSNAQLGVGRDETDTSAALVDVYPNGAVSTDRMDPERFGLRGITQVGQQRAELLRQAGLTTPAAVAAADRGTVADLDGIGSATAATIRTASKAVTTGQVVPTGDDSLPRGDPVFIDIETDGRNPSTAWLIGVLDGDAETGKYLPFREERPGDGTHLDAFMTWLTGSAAGRPVVAWHGYKFDFPVIEDQLRRHCPEHVAAWNDTYCFDPLYWARDKNGGNAALPGRTNKLEAVAAPLGWEPSTTGIDGGTVAAVYVDWRTRFERASDPRSVTEPPWTRLERYCEDDVRALATVYEALCDAAKRDPDSSVPTGTDSTQGALSDFT